MPWVATRFPNDSPKDMSARAICYYERTSTSPVAGIEHVNVSSVPIVLLALSRQKLAQMQLFDFGQNFIRPQLATAKVCPS